MKQPTLPLWRRIVAAFILLQLALGPLATPAYAQLTKLADEPIGFTPTAAPNIMLTVDDSTSMLSDFLPDYVIGGFCRDASGNMGQSCGFVGSPTSPQYIWSAGDTLGAPRYPYPRYAPGNPPNASAYSGNNIPNWMAAWPAPVHANALNRLYYDPAIEYEPAMNYDGTPFPDYGSPWTAVSTDPWAPAAAVRSDNLTTNVRIGMWCNSDFPTDTNPTTGGQCRINGNSYASATPAAPAEYQYPWRVASETYTASNSGGRLMLTYATDWPDLTPVRFSGGTLPGGLTTTAIFWLKRQSPTTAFVATTRENAVANVFVAYTSSGSGTRSLFPDDTRAYRFGSGGVNNQWNAPIYCDTTHPLYPRNTPCTPVYGAGSCGAGTYIPLPNLPQYCYDQGPKLGSCTNTYSPAGCNVPPTPPTVPRYGAPGCTAAGCCVGSECDPCNVITCTRPTIGREGQCGTNSSRPQPPSTRADCDCNTVGCTINPNHAACTPVAQPGVGTCSNGVAPTPISFTCSVNGSNDCNLRMFNPTTRLNDGTRLIDDANGNGYVCRRNNKAYAAGPDGQPAAAANPFNYPSTRFVTQKTGSCPAVNGYAAVPRHYWKTSVEWCSAQITDKNHKWRSFGREGTCQNERTAVYQYPRFYKYGVPNGRKPNPFAPGLNPPADPAYLDNVTFPAFERVDLVPASFPRTHQVWRWRPDGGAFQTVTRTYTEEMTNYANWFAYYRTRIQAAKTVISRNIEHLDDSYRVGFHTLSNIPASSFADIRPFNAAAGGQKDLWYQKLFAISIPLGNETPNMDAVVRIGELFRNGGNASLSGATDPIVLSCQKNYHMLFTDGITNQPALPGVTVGNVDDIVPALPQPLVVLPPIVAGSPWPDLYREDTANSMQDTMSDYATHYWVTDLRPGMTDNVFRGRDPAPWQHLNFAALSLGTEGTLPSSRLSTEARLAAGTLRWPRPAPSQYAPGPTGVDDLWHAAVNGRGRFVNAKTSQELGRGIADILNDITSPAGGLTGAVFANPNLSGTNNHTYLAGFVQGWGGNLQKMTIDPLTGAPLAVIWEASAALTGQVTPVLPTDTPWFTNRRIVTVNETGAKVPFLRGNLGPTQLATLGPDTASQDAVIEYLRGNRANEGEEEGQFRVRPSVLGDIVNSQPVVVGDPEWAYEDTNDPGYSAFKAAHAGRSKRVYVGANDGMLHAFNDADGTEAWAFVPRDLYRSEPPAGNDKAGLVGLTFQPGSLPAYAHRFYVDATPRVVDANLAGTWKTLLVGGLGKGGKSYYALDVTDPAVASEAAAAGKVLWEFRDGDGGADLGYTFGRATIIKTRAFGGRWLVVVASGYNNSTGVGKLYFLDAATGSLLKTMSTGVGSPGAPSGLAHFNAYVQDYRNQLADQFYGGDLQGNLWRFNVMDANDGNWTVERFAKLTDDSSVDQPITIPPMVEVDIANGVDRWVFVGTGKLTHACDLPDYYAANQTAPNNECLGQPNPSQRQRMYALRDGTFDTPSVVSAGNPLTFDELDSVSGVAGLGAGVIATRGWYDDLPAGQRIVRPIAATVGLVAYIATGLPTDPCNVSQPADVYVRQFGNGESRLETSPGSGVFQESVHVDDGGAGLSIVSTVDPSCTSNCIPKLRLAVTTTRPELRLFSAALPGFVNQNRISWRQLGQ